LSLSCALAIFDLNVAAGATLDVSALEHNMSRMQAFLLLSATLVFTACQSSVAPVVKPLTAEEQAALGTYTVTLVNGKTLPTRIGEFISPGVGAAVTVIGGTLVLESQIRRFTGGSAYPARLNVSVLYDESGPPAAHRIDTRETVPSWSLSSSTFSFLEGNPGFVMTAGTLSGRTATITTSGAGFYGAPNPVVVLTLTKN
jgi:hypothetical protein